MTVIPPRRRHKKDYWLQRNARQMQLRCQISQWMHQRLFSVFCQWGPVAISGSGSRNFERGIQCISPNAICCKCTYLMNYIYIFCTGKGDLLKKCLRSKISDSESCITQHLLLLIKFSFIFILSVTLSLNALCACHLICVVTLCSCTSRPPILFLILQTCRCTFSDFCVFLGRHHDFIVTGKKMLQAPTKPQVSE